MPLDVGTRLGSCEVLGPLGAGGMGEVYRARDLRLGREVALKVLPDAVANEPSRRARFEREARLLAALNHPQIAAIYGLLEAGGAPVLVLELVEGETLDARLARAPLPVPEALVIAVQIAEGLEAAHEAGILHRDLKPSNVKLTRDGRAKLLDFGLAKALNGEPGGSAGSSSEDTVTSAADATAAGAVMGTASFMSPEQARGERIDKRADVWSFGCVLFEMMSGRRAFGGPTRTAAIVAVLEREPDWAALSAEVPQKVRDLLHRCLKKDKADRLRDIADARLELVEARAELASGRGSEIAGGTSRRVRMRLRTIGLGAATLLASFAVWTWLRPPSPTPALPRRLTISLPPGVRLPHPNNPCHMALSPDGSRLAFVGVSAKGRQLYLRDLDAIEARPIPQTENGWQPFFSPDGRWLGFYQDAKLKKLRLDDGGTSMPICDAPRLRGAAWGPDETIVFTPEALGGLWQVSANGGQPRRLTDPDHTKEASHRFPQVLPLGREAVFALEANSFRPDESRIGLLSLETSQWHVVLEGGSYGRYISSGYLLYGRDGTVFAAPFDMKRREVTGAALPVLDDVSMDSQGTASAQFDVSASGSLAYIPGYPHPVDRSILWVDREGRRQQATGLRAAYQQIALSPDGRRAAATIEETSSTHLWVLDLASDTRRRLTSEKDVRHPVWSSDGTHIFFSSNRDGSFNIYRMPVDGSGPPERLTTSPWLQELSDSSLDGRLLAFHQQDPGTKYGIWTVPLQGQRQASPVGAETHTELSAVFSPDGRWMAYVSDETGRLEVYVRPFPGPGPRVPLSRGSGEEPRWARSGREIFYRAGWGSSKSPKLMAVAVEAGSTFRAGMPKPLFDDAFAGWGESRNYDASPDGQRFLMIEQPDEVAAPNQIVVIPDFAAELRQKFRAAGR